MPIVKPPAVRHWHLYAGTFALLLAIVLGLGFWLTNSLYRHSRDYALENLANVSAMKAGELQRWLGDKTSHLAQAPSGVLATAFYRWQSHHANADAELIARRLDQFKSVSPEYANLWLFDLNGDLRFSSAGAPLHPAAHYPGEMDLARTTLRPVIVDFHMDPVGEGKVAPMLEMLVPLFVGLPGSEHPIGYLLYQIDPEPYLFPMFRRWPSGSDSAESLLFRIEGDEIVYLSRLRHNPAQPLTLSQKMSLPRLLAAQAARSDGRSVEGVDYRGVEAVGVAVAIPAMKWYLLSKIDEAELFADARRIALVVGGGVCLLLLGMLGGGWLLLRQMRGRAETARLAAEVARLQTAEALRTSEARYQAIVNSQSWELCRWKPDTTLTFVNYAYAAGRAIPCERLVGSRWLDLIPESQRAEMAAIVEDLVAAPRTSSHEQLMEGPDDRSHWMVWTDTPIFDAAGQVAEFQSVGLEITARKEAELALTVSEERFRAIVDNIQEAIFIQDIDTGAILSVNRRACELYGMDEEQLIAASIQDLSSGVPPYGQADAAFWMMRAAAGDPQSFEWHAKDGGGGLFWIEVTIRRARIGDQDRLLAVVRDISQRKAQELELRENLERQVQLNRKLEEAHNQLLQAEKMASIGQLAAGVAHELNNPIGFVHSNMGSLEGYLKDLFEIIDAYEAVEKTATDCSCVALDRVRQLKADRDYEFLKTDIAQLLVESKDGLVRVRKIVQDLKDFSRVGEAEWQWANLHQGIDSTLNIVWNELKYKCTVTKDYGTLPEVYCLPSQLNQVFMNLLVNAGQAIEKQGVITIRTGTNGVLVWVEIADTGKGIPKENLNRIFEPFFTTKPVGQGTGLGLSLAYGIVLQHQGRIEVASDVGRGTTFRVVLPIKPELENAEEPPN